MTQNNSGSSKMIEKLSCSSSNNESQQQIYTPSLPPKKQQQPETIISNKQEIKIEVEFSRQAKPKVVAEKSSKKGKKKKNKINAAHGEQNMVKKQQRRKFAAPPQLITDSSKTSSEKSQKSIQQKAAPDQPTESKRLYIGNLPLEFSQLQIRKLFKKYGSLKQVKLSVNSTTGKSKGFGFVQYNEIHSAMKAKEQMSIHIIGGQKITIEFCQIQ